LETTVAAAAGAPLAWRAAAQAPASGVTGAMESLRAGIATAEKDPSRPIYHFRPPAFWNNDPNGTIFYRGWHHLFYQLNPAAPRGGNQHWGHARSRDLVNWEHLPIALWPLTDRGERAIFSGGAIIAADGRPRLFYTSIGHPMPEQWIAVPQDDDLIRLERPAVNPILTADAHGPLSVAQWRDPFLFKEAGSTYMVCGGNLNNGRGGGGSVQLYKSANADLTRWQFVGVVFQYADLQIYNVECPNLFRLGDKWVLLMSPQQPCEYFIGQLDLARPRFTPESHGILDAGTSYASNISFDDRGRTILWLWGRTNTPPDRGWNGCMTLPRVLSIASDGFLRQQPPTEFETLRGAPVDVPPMELVAGTPSVLERIQGDSFEFTADVMLGGSAEAGFDLRRSASGTAGVAIRIARPGTLVVGSVRTPISRGLDRYRLRVFADKRVVEVFVNDGEAAVFSTIDAADNDLAIAAVAQAAPPRAGGAGGAGGRGGAPAGNARIENLKFWPMKAAQFSLDRFKL
jgi:beta-fructofuranosidase